MSSLSAKLGDRSLTSGKSKYLSQNINQTYSGKSALPAKTSGSVGKHGLQSLSSKQTAVVRRMPPPVHLPSLRSESSALGSAEADSAANAAAPPNSAPSWAPHEAPAPQPVSTGPQPLIPKLREPAGGQQPRWMGESGPSPRDFPSLATATDPKLAMDSQGPSLRPQKVGSWKAGGAGGAGKEEEHSTGSANSPPPHPTNGLEEPRTASPNSGYSSRHYQPNTNGNSNNGFNPPFVSQRPPPPPNAFFRQNGPPPLMRGGYDRDYYDGPQPQHQQPRRYGGPHDRQGPYPPDDYRGPPRHYDQDYGMQQPRGDRGVWSDEEPEHNRMRPPMSGRGDPDYMPPPQREQYRDYDYDDRYGHAPPPMDRYGPPIHSQDYRNAGAPPDRYGHDWYGPPPQNYGHPRGYGAPYPEKPYGEYDERGAPPSGGPPALNGPPHRHNMEEEEEEERRLRWQQEKEREAAIQRSRQKRRGPASCEDGPSEDGEPTEEQPRPLSRDEHPPAQPQREGPPPQMQHRRQPPQPHVPPRFQRHNADEQRNFHPQPALHTWDEEGYTPRNPERKEEGDGGQERGKDYRKHHQPKRTERGQGRPDAKEEGSSWRPPPKKREEKAKESEAKEEDEAPQLQTLAAKSKAVKRTPKQPRPPSASETKDVPDPAKAPASAQGGPVESGGGPVEKVEAAPEPAVNVWEKRAEERESAERQLREEADALLRSNAPALHRQAPFHDERRMQAPRNREFYNSRRGGALGPTNGFQRHGGGPEVPVRAGGGVHGTRGRGGISRRGGSVPLLPRRRERDDEDEEGEELGPVLGPEEDTEVKTRENGKEPPVGTGREQRGRGGRRGGSSRRSDGLQYPAPGYYFQPLPEGQQGTNGPRFGDGSGRGERRGGRGGSALRDRGAHRLDENGERRRPARHERGKPASRKPKKDEVDSSVPKEQQLSVPGGVKSPSHSEGQDEWETASESSDIVSRPLAAAKETKDQPSSAPSPPVVEKSLNGKESQSTSKVPRKGQQQQPKNGKPASRQAARLGIGKSTGEQVARKAPTDALAGLDIHDIASVVAIDDHPDSATAYLWDADEFQEVVSRKEKRARNKAETEKREKREARSASNRTGPDRRHRKAAGSPPPKSNAPPLIPPLTKQQPSHQAAKQPTQAARTAPTATDSVFLSATLWDSEGAGDGGGTGVAAALEDYVKKSNWGSAHSPKKDDQPSKTGTEIWGRPDPLPAFAKAEPDRPEPPKSVEFPDDMTFGGETGGGGIDFTFDPSLPTPAPAFLTHQVAPAAARAAVVDSPSGEDDSKLSQRLKDVRKVWELDATATQAPEKKSFAPAPPPPPAQAIMEGEEPIKEAPQVAKVNPLPQPSPQAPSPRFTHVSAEHLFPSLADPHSATGPLGKAFYASSATVSPPMLGHRSQQPPDFSQPPPSQPPMFGHGIWQAAPAFSQPPPTQAPPVFPSADVFNRPSNAFYHGLPGGPPHPPPQHPPPAPGGPKASILGGASPLFLDGSTSHTLLSHAPVFGAIGSQRQTPAPASTQAPPPNSNYFLTASPQPPLGPPPPGPPPPHSQIFGQGLLGGPPPSQAPGSKLGGPLGMMGGMGSGAGGFGMGGPVCPTPGNGGFYGRPLGPPASSLHPPLSAQSSGPGPAIGFPPPPPPPPTSTPHYHHLHHPHNGFGRPRSNGGATTEAKKPESPKAPSEHNAPTPPAKDD